MHFYPLKSLLAVALFALVHLFANQARRFDHFFHSRLLSIGGGIAIAYVFVDILPKLSRHEPIIAKFVRSFFPYFERHVYIMALLGFLLFFIIDRAKNKAKSNNIFFYLSLSSYALLNLLIGYAVVDIDNPEVKPLLLFSIAIALHYFVNDYALSETLGFKYDHLAKWILVAALFFGWLLGLIYTLPAAAVGLVSAFIGGGIIMNVTRHELPNDHPHSLPAFLISAAVYTIILLSIG